MILFEPIGDNGWAQAPAFRDIKKML